MELKELRTQIDEIDDQLITLFARRMEISAAIGSYKKERGLPILVPQRELEKLADIGEKAGPELSDFAQRLYQQIFALSREYQGMKNGEVK